jgi:IS4 transposase
MSDDRLVFSQVTDFLHREQFERCVERYPMPRASRTMSARDQFLCMVFAQITYRESLRDIEACLHDNCHLHDMGIRGNVTRTNLAYANERRDWRIYADMAQVLIRKARRLYAKDVALPEIDQIVYALDSTTIDLCMSLFPWADFRSTKAGVKMHTLMDLRGSIPVFISITDANVHDVNILDRIVFEPGSIYLVDRGYVDYGRLYGIEKARAFFVTRAKRKMRFNVCESRPVDGATGLRCDQTITLTLDYSKTRYPEKLRRVHYVDPDTKQSLNFLTNHFNVSALTVAKLYKCRWQIELFFKWIKQNLRIKVFYGTSENAVKTQIWIAICAYLLVAIMKKEYGITEGLARILQVLSVNVFQKVAVNELLTDTGVCDNIIPDRNQLEFNDF